MRYYAFLYNKLTLGLLQQPPFDYSSSQSERHLIRHVADVTISEKNNSSAPETIAYIRLVVATSTARSIIAAKIVPKIPVNIVGNAVHVQIFLPLLDAMRSSTPSAATATANNTHGKIVGIIIELVNTRNVVIIPIIILATTASPVQSVLQLQLLFDIYITSTIIYAKTHIIVNMENHISPRNYNPFTISITSS